MYATPLTKLPRANVVPLFVSEPVRAVNVVVVEDDERTIFSPVPSVAAPEAFESDSFMIVPFVAAAPVTAPEVTCDQVAAVADEPVVYVTAAVLSAPVIVAVVILEDAISADVSYAATRLPTYAKIPYEPDASGVISIFNVIEVVESPVADV
jgi:hypothetical protein